MTTFSIYLAGNIQKGHEKESGLFWTKEDCETLRQSLPSVDFVFLNPAARSDDLSDQKSVFGRDMAQVFLSDLVLVDVRERRGLGVGAEMLWAKVNGTPLIALAPHDSHYRKAKMTLLGRPLSNWVHPFVESLSDAVVSDLTEAARWIQGYLKGESAPIKTGQDIIEAMHHYKETQYPNDLPMQELVAGSELLQQRIDTLGPAPAAQ